MTRFGYATGVHHLELTVPAGSGDVPPGDYRLAPALGAVRAGRTARPPRASFLVTA